jgi:hypothetical protein
LPRRRRERSLATMGGVATCSPRHLSSPWWKSGVAPRRARRPDRQARRRRIPGVCDGGATQRAGMHRPSNAARLSP